MIYTKIVETDTALAQCLQVRRAVFVGEQKVPPELEVDEFDTLGAATHVQLVDELSNTALGTARIKPYKETSAKVQRVAVLSSHRGAGLGRVLMNFVEDVASQQGYVEVVLDAQLTAEGFYLKLGYGRVSDDIFLDADIEHVRMEKIIIPSSNLV